MNVDGVIEDIVWIRSMVDERLPTASRVADQGIGVSLFKKAGFACGKICQDRRVCVIDAVASVLLAKRHLVLCPGSSVVPLSQPVIMYKVSNTRM